MIAENIEKLVQYGLYHDLIETEDIAYVRNVLLSIMQMDAPDGEFAYDGDSWTIDLKQVLEELIGAAAAYGLVDADSVVSRDLFDTKLMGAITPRPHEVTREFWRIYEEESPKAATDYFYRLCKDCDYIRSYRIVRDRKWQTDTEYGKLDITINLSKPEKDPKAIAAAGKSASVAYPRCQLCRENEGYAGRMNHPARENLRIIPITINGTDWGFQYSPYVYYNEHCIVLNGEHVPMAINHDTFVKLFDFVRLFPHYFLGSNADLPIVGGSILSHDHFQGGRYEFAMARAPIETGVVFPGFEDVCAGIVRWPMSVIRLRSESVTRVIELADRILAAWRGYTDESVFIYAKTQGEPHNTITPIARMRDGVYELDLVLRNNITTPEHPLGVFHPHANLHHIKKENIGLIEVMGLAVLPARLDREMAAVREALLTGADLRGDELTAKHADWVESFVDKYDHIDGDNIDTIIHDEIGLVFLQVLMDAGVFKRDSEGQAAFLRFIEYAGH